MTILETAYDNRAVLASVQGQSDVILETLMHTD
jgi:hypothetical protein